MQIRCCRDGELRQDPAVIDLVVLNNWVAVVVGFATAAEPGPDGISSHWTHHKRAGRFVEHGERFVYPLYKLRGSNDTVCVGGRRIGRETVIAITNPGEVQPGSCSDQRADIYLRYRILLLRFQELDRQPSHRLGFANGSRLWRPCDVAQSR